MSSVPHTDYSPVYTVPSLSKIYEEMIQKLRIQPCLWQIKVIQAILQNKKHIVSIAGSRIDKTLMF
ncbi:hypothetical protein BDZ97DRAFT_1647226 [Flammula alnicola]|nr:hypothetical protein BDZ97DRAFT_1647226 [Flammula alnicola]